LYLGPAGFFVDHNNYDNYLEHSSFLPYLNNEKNYSSEAKSKFEALEEVMFVMFNQDSIIYPKESAWFN
jgi:palmitoyl-protein thioesterase